MNEIAIKERVWLQATAEQYRREGYDVEIEPRLDFLPGLRPDLVARKDGENRVIEVKSRSALASRSASDIARIVRAQPGWSFDLVLVGEPERVDSPDGSLPLDRDSVARRADEAEQALAAGHIAAALLLAWAAWEAAVRVLIDAEEPGSVAATGLGEVRDQARFRGFVSSDEYDRLKEMRRFRNAIAHGFSVSAFSEELVRELIAMARTIAAMDAEPGEL